MAKYSKSTGEHKSLLKTSKIGSPDTTHPKDVGKGRGKSRHTPYFDDPSLDFQSGVKDGHPYTGPK